MKVYEYQGFPNPARVRVALYEKNAIDSVEFIQVDVPSGEHRQPAFLERNPSAAVPVLELECGTCISECTAITEYIDHAFSGPSLTGKDAKQRAKVHMMQRRAEQMVMDAVGTYFHQATEGLGKALEGDQNTDWGLRQKAVAETGMAYFNQVLATTPFVAGEDFSMADITLFMGLGFADFADIEIPVEHQHLSAWRQRVASRPSVLALSN